jgi:hypothetical protein
MDDLLPTCSLDFLGVKAHKFSYKKNSNYFRILIFFYKKSPFMLFASILGLEKNQLPTHLPTLQIPRFLKNVGI